MLRLVMTSVIKQNMIYLTLSSLETDCNFLTIVYTLIISTYLIHLDMSFSILLDFIHV